MVGSDHCFRPCRPSIRPHVSKQNEFQVKTMFATGKTVCLASGSLMTPVLSVLFRLILKCGDGRTDICESSYRYICMWVGLVDQKYMKCFLDRYNLNETGVTMSINRAENESFPTFTICPEYRQQFDEIVLQNFGLEILAYRKSGALPVIPIETSNITARKLYLEATPDLDDIIERVEVQTLSPLDEKSNEIKFISAETQGMFSIC